MAFKNDKTKNRRRYKTRYRSSHNYKQKRSSSQTKAAVLVSVLTFVVIASVVITFAFGDDIYNYLDKTMQNITAKDNSEKKPLKITVNTEAPSEKPTKAPAPTEPPTEAETTPPVKQDADFENLLKLNNIKETDIVGSQIIFVDSESDLSCKLYCYEKDSNGKWKKALSDFSGYVGSQGVSSTIAPNEQKTPLGLYRIEYAAGTSSDPGTGLDYDQFVYGDEWITDPNSAYYNRWMSEGSSSDWETSQRLWRYTVSYPYMVVFDYNRENPDRSQGCAKFLHVQYAPTEGGIGVSESDLVTILQWLAQSKSPYIAISE